MNKDRVVTIMSRLVDIVTNVDPLLISDVDIDSIKEACAICDKDFSKILRLKNQSSLDFANYMDKVAFRQ